MGEYIKEASLKGDFPKFKYMYFYDKIQIVKNKPCLYGAKLIIGKEPMDEELTYKARKELGVLDYFEKRNSKKNH